MAEPVSRSILVIDIEAYSRRSDPIQRSLRAAMYDVFHSALADCHLPENVYSAEDRGDGLIVLFTPDVSPILLAGEFMRAVEASLREKAEMFATAHRLRLRAALHQGLVTRDDAGWSGDAVNTACRLVDSDPVRTALADNENAHLALIVAGAFWDTVIRPGHRSLDGTRFASILVSVKNLVDYPARLAIFGGGDTTPSGGGTTTPDERGTTRPAPAASPAGGQVINNHGVDIHGDQFTGGKTSYGWRP